MTINKDKLKEELLDMVEKAQVPDCPFFLDDDRLEDAFKTPVMDDDGKCEPLPAIWNDYGYGKYDDGVLFITLKSASIMSNLYSKYLDEKALVWDSVKEKLFLYIPDPAEPRMAFKGSRWQYAKRLKTEFKDSVTLRGVYCELIYFE